VDLDARVVLRGPGPGRHLNVATSPWAIASPSCLGSVTERRVWLTRFNGSNKEALLRNVRVAHGVNAVMEAVETPHSRPPLDRIVAEATGCKLANIQNTFEPSGRLRHQEITPREVFSAVSADFTSLGE
jgi:hypothetical protein